MALVPPHPSVLDRPPPSVLLGPPTSLAPASGPLIRCSQCKKDRPLSHFPIRLNNLQPYQVCTAHDWYWTDAKKASLWAPTRTSTVEQLCDEVKQLKDGRQGAPQTWKLEGSPEDRAALVQRIAAAGGWKSKTVKHRQSVSKKDSAPSPTFPYTLTPLDPSDPCGAFKLTLYHHTNVGQFTLHVHPDEKDKQGARPRSRPQQRAPKQLVEVPDRQGEETSVMLPVAQAAPAGGKRHAKGGGRTKNKSEKAAVEPKNSLDMLAAAVDSVSGDIPVDGPLPRGMQAHGAEEDLVVEAGPPRSSQEMPPPPLPPPRPPRPKKARRVEPSLVSSTPTSMAASTTPAKPLDTSWADFLSFPGLSSLSADPASSPTSSLPVSSGPFDYSNDAAILALLNTFPTTPASPSSAPSTALPALHQPLTLADLLANPAFDPPNIPLPPRQPAPSFAAAQPHAPRAPSRLRTSTSSRDGTPDAIKASKAGRDLDDAVAAALGGGGVGRKRTRTESGRTSATVSEDENNDGDGEEGEGYYEDSIPDDSSDEEPEDDDEDLDDAASGSSFFQSSADEDDCDGDGEGGRGRAESSGSGEDSDDADDGGDWLAGFVSRQMPGLSGAAQQESGRREGLHEDDEVDELDSGEESR
ncbi:hypothetical protein JCM10213_004586 [Rhodosporidiobolus nylandii]